MNVSVVVPWVPSKPFNPICVEPGDELIVVDSSLPIFEARWKGIEQARHEWIVCADSDAVYPKDYIPKVKRAILSGRYPYGFRTKRIGGFGHNFNVEASIVARKDLLLEVCKNFRKLNYRDDFGRELKWLPVVEDITYYHGFTTGEKQSVAVAVSFALFGLALMAPKTFVSH